MRIRSLLNAFILAAVCIGLSSVVSSVAPIAHAHAIAVPQRSVDMPDRVTILILGMSATMSTNDPTNIRCSVADTYIDMSKPNDVIGVIGLDNNDGSHENGPYTFETAKTLLPPTQLNAPNAQQQMQQEIETRSNQCRADGATPTYDALSTAFTMLKYQTNGGQLPGSVVLFTDSLPSPDTNGQITAIHTLLPQFQHYRWPIHTIALGPTNPSLDSFLSNLKNNTAGNFYSDDDGTTISPMNLTQFFTDSYTILRDRKVVATILPTSINGTTQSYPIPLSANISLLDILVIKDTSNISVTLTSPPPQQFTLPPEVNEVNKAYVSIDSDYAAIFSVPQPQQGTWNLNISGSGNFLYEELFTSALKIKIISPKISAQLPLGTPITISANATNDQAMLVGNLAVDASIYTGLPSQDRPLAKESLKESTTGTYIGTINISDRAPAGLYTLVVSINSISGTGNTKSDSHSIYLSHQLFPYFLSQQTQQPTPKQASYFFNWNAIWQWHVTPLPWYWPIEFNLAQPSFDIPFAVEYQGSLYPNALVSATAVPGDSTKAIPISIKGVDDGGGRYHLPFASTTADGTYIVSFTMSSNATDISRNTPPVLRTIYIQHVPPLVIREVSVFFVNLFLNLLLFFVLYSICRHLLCLILVMRPFDECLIYDSQGQIAYGSFREHYNPWWWILCGWFLLGPKLLSESVELHPINPPLNQLHLPPGLEFRFRKGLIFHRGGIIEARPYGTSGPKWKDRYGTPMKRRFRPVEMLYLYDNPGAPGAYSISLMVSAIIQPTTLSTNVSSTVPQSSTSAGQANQQNQSTNTPSPTPPPVQGQATPTNVPPNTPPPTPSAMHSALADLHDTVSGAPQSPTSEKKD